MWSVDGCIIDSKVGICQVNDTASFDAAYSMSPDILRHEIGRKHYSLWITGMRLLKHGLGASQNHFEWS